MNQAETFAQLGQACLMTSDMKGAAENYAKAVELGIKNEPKSKKLADWFLPYCSSLAADQNYEKLKEAALKYIKYSEEVKNYSSLVSAYEFIITAHSNIPNFDNGELEKYKDLEKEANRKKLEDEQAANPIFNSIKAKSVLLAFDPEAKVNRNCSEEDFKIAESLNVQNLLSSPEFSRQIEAFAKKIVSSIEIIKIKKPDSLIEAKALSGLVLFSFTVASFLSFDCAVADFALKCLEKARSILEKIDKASPDLIGLFAIGANMLKSYPDKKQTMDKYQKLQDETTKEFTRIMNEKKNEYTQKLQNLEEAKEDMEQRLDKVELEQKNLGDKFSQLQSNVDLLQNNMTETSDKLKIISQQKENLEDMTLLNSLMEKERALIEKKTFLKRIGENKDLSDYYNSLRQSLESVYIGARAAASGKVEASKSSSFSDAASFASKFITMIPMFGNILSSVVSGLASIGDGFLNAKDDISMTKLKEVAPDILKFSEFIEEVVLAYVKKNESKIIAYNGENINNKEWKEMLKSAVTLNFEDIFKRIFSENDSKAKVQGRADSSKIINYLQKGYISIQPGQDIKEYVQWVVEEKDFKKETEKPKSKKKPTGCLCFGKKKTKVVSEK